MKRLIKVDLLKVRKMNEGIDDNNSFLSNVIYWILYPFRNSYRNKMRALLEGLEAQNIDKFMKEGKTGDYRNFGKAYIGSVREKVECAKSCR